MVRSRPGGDYLPRGGNLRGLALQYFEYGRWKRAVLARHPRSWRARQLAAPLLLGALAGSALLAAAGGAIAAGVLAPVLAPAAGGALLGAAAVCPAGYGLLLLGASVGFGLHRRRSEAALLPVVAATIHLAFGAGFFAGAPGRFHRTGR